MNNLEYICKITLEKAINDIKSLQEFQNYTTNKIKEGLLKEANSWEGIMVKGNSDLIDISLEGNKDIYDENNNIMPQIINFDENDKKYLCIIIDKNCLDSSNHIPLHLKYLCNEKEYETDSSRHSYYLFSDENFNLYYYKYIPNNNCFFTKKDVKLIKLEICKRFPEKYILIIIDKLIYSIDSIINGKFSLLNEDDWVYLKDVEIKNPLFYGDLLPDDKPIIADSYNLKQIFTFNQAFFLLYKLLSCTENKWKIIEVKNE